MLTLEDSQKLQIVPRDGDEHAMEIEQHGSCNGGPSRDVDGDDEGSSSSAPDELPWNHEIEGPIVRRALEMYESMPSNEAVDMFEEMFREQMRKRIITDGQNIIAVKNINSKLRAKNSELMDKIAQNNTDRFRMFYKRYKMFLEFQELMKEYSYVLTEKDLQVV